uniref:Uncharacterized protein n=1 Tax=Anguilla anguilla TaxID=7936 RepID=A0A0E9U2E4_ANGAN
MISSHDNAQAERDPDEEGHAHPVS